jgi:hypothetical protein
MSQVRAAISLALRPVLTAVLPAMLTYNLLVTAYLMYLGFGGKLVGILLWPAVGIHAVLTLGFAYAWFNDQRTEATTR